LDIEQEAVMDSELTGIFSQLNVPLGGLVEPGAGFRIGSPSFPFVLADRKGNRWTYINHEHKLQVESVVRPRGSAVVIAARLKNIGEQPSSPIHVLEPLYLVFRQPQEKWRHLFANGGTTERYYPPTAYRTHDWSRSRQTLTIESHPEGRSSNLHLPLLISLASAAEDADGLFCGMEWSAGWYIRFEKGTGSQSCLAAGVKVNGLRLEPGESLNLPEVHLGFFTGGPAAGTNALRRYLHENVCARYHGKPMIPRVSYDHWFGIDNRFNVDLLKAEAKRAAELGVEVFVLDAAWFSGDFPEGVGNWDSVDRRKFPAGLEPLADYVRELGMDFGLWFEPERAVEGTWFVRRHPDWFVPVPGWGKGQFYHLNLADSDVQDYLIEMVGGWIKRLNLRWTRWDYNINPRPFWEAVDPTMKIQFSYLEGLYRVLDALMAKYPDWMVEGCASGGLRLDIGTMKRAHTFWFSDQTEDPCLCRYMQARANRFLPGHLLNSSVPVELVGPGDFGFDDTAILSRMLGKLAFDGHIASWSPELTARMARWVGEFKAIRHLLAQDFYQLLPMPTTIEDWDAVQFASYSGDESALFVFSREKGGRKTIVPHGLKREGEYTLNRRPDGSPQAVPGLELLERGFPVELGPNEAGLWRIALAQQV